MNRQCINCPHHWQEKYFTGRIGGVPQYRYEDYCEIDYSKPPKVKTFHKGKGKCMKKGLLMLH